MTQRNTFGTVVRYMLTGRKTGEWSSMRSMVGGCCLVRQLVRRGQRVKQQSNLLTVHVDIVFPF
jgi:hypothetical protein